MSHKKDGAVWQHPFRLRSGDPNEVRLHEHLVALAQGGAAQAWIMQTLLAALPAQPKQVGVPSNHRRVITEPSYADPEESA